MIVFEDKLAELVGVLPQITVGTTDLQVKFDWGTEEKLAQYLLINGRLSFPLIWLAEGIDTNDLREPSVKRNARLVILYESQQPDQFNPYFHEFDYTNVLQPIADNLLIALQYSGISRINDVGFKSQRIKNYSVRGAYETNANEKESANQSLVFICNAIVIDAEITLTEGCINPNIQFNN